MRLTEGELQSADQWAACDLREGEGRRVQALVEEVRASRLEIARLRSELMSANDKRSELDAENQELTDKYNGLRALTGRAL